jgi:hypothetical protein
MRLRASRGKRAIAVDLGVAAVALALATQALVSGTRSSAIFTITFAVLWLAGVAPSTRF